PNCSAPQKLRRHSDDYLPEVGAAGHIFQRLARFLEGESFVDDWFQAVCRNGAIHVLKHFAGTNENALQPNAFHQNFDWIETTAAGQNTDHGNDTANAGGVY